MFPETIIGESNLVRGGIPKQMTLKLKSKGQVNMTRCRGQRCVLSRGITDEKTVVSRVMKTDQRSCRKDKPLGGSTGNKRDE